MAASDNIIIAKFTAPHGLRGLVKCACYLEERDMLKSYNPLQASDGNQYTLAIKGTVKQQLLVAVEGITTKEQAELLRNVSLSIPADTLPETDGEIFYIHALKDCAVYEHNVHIGTVKAMHNFGAGDIMEILPHEGSSFMIPFTKEAVPEVDLDGKRVNIIRPDMLIAKQS